MIDYVTKLRKKLVIDSVSDNFQNSVENITCDQCDGLNNKLNSLKNELDAVSKLSFHLEKRTQDQEDLILLLKQLTNDKLHEIPVLPSTSNTDYQNTMISRNKNIHQNKILNDIDSRQKTEPKAYSAAIKNNPSAGTSQKHDTEEKTNINTNRRNPRQLSKTSRYGTIIGTNGDTTLNTVPKKGFLHVYRIGPDITTADLTDCLKKTAPSIKFECEELNRNERASSYKVSFPIEMVAEVYNPKLWPRGAAVRRFIFKQNFRTSVETEQNT